MTCLHNSVEFSLIEAGHTKFDLDWHFGMFKRNGGNPKTTDQFAAIHPGTSITFLI